ncbi:MAG: hypothetical protein R3D81_03635 [Thalassovita sp.]
MADLFLDWGALGALSSAVGPMSTVDTGGVTVDMGFNAVDGL